MRIFADYHTHTIYSHGKNTIRENVEAAIDKGLREISITDHGPGHMFFGVKKENLKKMRQEIDELNEEYKNIKIFLGLEANILSRDGDVDVDDEMMKIIDMLLVGFHYGARPKKIKDAYDMYILNKVYPKSPRIRNKCIKVNTQSMVNAINNYDIKFITHPGAKLEVDIAEVAKAAGKRNTALEINAHHGHLSVGELRIAMNENVKFVISSDAHCKEDVGNVQQAIDRAFEAGVDKKQIINIE